MNLGLLAFTILVFCTPGFFFRRAYYSGVFSKQYFKQNFVESITSTLLPSLLIHMCGYFVMVQWNFEFDIPTIATLISGSDDVMLIIAALDNLYYHFFKIFIYFFLLNTLSFMLGYLWKFIVRKYRLDSRLKLLRFKNEWHYIFSGEILNFPNVAGDSSDINFAYIDVVTEIDGASYIYSGILLEYILSKEHILETICLSNVRRRKISDEFTPSSDYYYVPGNFIVFKYNQIQNINITYYNWEEVETL